MPAAFLQVVDGLEQGEQYRCSWIPSVCPAIQQEQTKYLHYIQGAVALADDIPVRSFRAVIFLDIPDGRNALQGILYHSFFVQLGMSSFALIEVSTLIFSSSESES